MSLTNGIVTAATAIRMCWSQVPRPVSGPSTGERQIWKQSMKRKRLLHVGGCGWCGDEAAWGAARRPELTVAEESRRGQGYRGAQRGHREGTGPAEPRGWKEVWPRAELWAGSGAMRSLPGGEEGGGSRGKKERPEGSLASQRECVFMAENARQRAWSRACGLRIRWRDRRPSRRRGLEARQTTPSTWVYKLRLVSLRETDARESFALLKRCNVVSLTLAL